MILEGVEIKPCPCCGEKKEFRRLKSGQFKGLYTGVTSSMEFGVRCYTCGLKMTRGVPDRWHPATKKMNLSDSMEWMKRFTLGKAIEAWNRRV